MTTNSENFDLTLWKLCLPIDEDGATTGVAYEILDLAGFEHSSYFYTAVDGAMVFRAITDGAITKGTTAARSELREMNADGTLAAWSLNEGGTMSATLKIDEAPIMADGSAGRIVIGQVHGSDEELVRLYWENGQVYFKSDMSSGDSTSTTHELTNADGETPDVSLGEEFSYLIQVEGSTVTVTVYADGETYTATMVVGSEWSDDAFYFKAGAYLGSNETNSSGAGQASFYGLDFGHEAGAGLDGLSSAVGPDDYDNTYSVDSTGTTGDDVLNGGSRSDVIYGYGGDDTIRAGAGDDRLVGGSGADTLRGEDGADTITAGAGNDTVVGGLGDDAITGGDGADSVYGGDGADTIDGGVDDDILRGEADSDVLSGDEGDDKLYGGAGGDDLNGDDGADVLYAGDGDDTLYGDDGADTLKGEAGDDTLAGDAGQDKLYGGDGADTLRGGNDADFLDGGGGADRLDGGADDDTIYGYAEVDRLYGRDGSDKLVGGDGDDILYGGAGNDLLYADAGADNLYGGTGSDVFVFTTLDSSTLDASGRDDVYEFSQSEGDILKLSAIDANTTVSGGQAFSFVDTAAFSGRAGELRYVNTSTETYVYGDTDGDGAADFSIHVDGVITLTDDDFVL